VFVGSQVITGSLYITTDLIVQGSSSLQNITASAVSIGTNVVMLNTATPAVRFAGISVQDSGSNAGVTGSIFWDGLCNRWIYSNPSNVGYSGGMILSGPRNLTTIGSESPLTCNYMAKSGGGDHLYDSTIYESGSYVGINTNSPYTNGLSVKGTADDYSLTVLQQNANTAGYGFFAGNSGDFSIARISGGSYITPALKIQLNTNVVCFNNTICAPSISVGDGTQSNESDAPLTIKRNIGGFAGLDFKSLRTTGNIGGTRFYDCAGVVQAQQLVEVDGSFNFYNATANKRFSICANGVASFACDLTAKTIGTNDLKLNNLNYECANYVDGTRGSWLIQEGENDLFIINQISCKKYKFNLIEIK
jgi:hypothetical protein